MRMRIAHLLIALLIAMVAVPAYAATYDATGRWFILTDPGQTITVLDIKFDVPKASLWATIEQPGGGDTFTLETDEITELEDISYFGKGTVTGSSYSFDPPLSETFDLEDLPTGGFDIDLELSLAGFELTSANRLIGEFGIKTLTGIPLGSIAFTGSMEVVPVPAGIWLLGSGIAALVGIRKRSLDRQSADSC